MMIYLAYEIIQTMKGEQHGDITFAKFFYKMLWMSFAYGLLWTPNQVWFPVFNAFAAIPGYLAGLILSAYGGYQGDMSGASGYITAIEKNFLNVIFDMFKHTISDVRIWDYLSLMFSAGVLVLVFGYLFYKQIATTLGAFAMLYVTGAFGVIWIAFMIFEETRPFFIEALKLMVTSVLQLTAVAMALAVTIAASAPLMETVTPDNLLEVQKEHFGNMWLTLLVNGLFMIFVFKAMIDVPSIIMRTYLNTAPTGSISRVAHHFVKAATGRL